MNNPRYKKHRLASSIVEQRGVALILVVFIMGLAAMALLMKSFSGESIQAERQEDTMRTLMQAKEAMIAWAVSHATAPGQLPWPDRRETSNPNYDGQSDCSSANFNLLNSLSEPNFLGQIPSISSTTPCLVYPGAGNQFRDSDGNNLWYAISRNLVRKYSSPASDPVINPSIISSPTYSWMRVRDSAGNVISDRVAIVILAPGAPVSGQDRSSSAPPPGEFLDQLTISGTTYSNSDYDTDDEDFVMGDMSSNGFNDNLVYITIDELMAALVKRAASELRERLIIYETANGRFPDAAPLQAPLGADSYVADSGSDSGTVPVDQTDEVSCTYSFFTDNTTCNVIFSLIGSVSLQRIAGVYTQWDTRTGSCTISPPNTCTCTGQGSCDTSQSHFSCSSTGSCVMNLSTGATGKFIYTAPSYGSFRAATANCSMSGDDVECIAGNGTFGIKGLTMPSWFASNNWQDYFYYHKRVAADLQAGTRTNIPALLIGTGRPIPAAPFAASKPGSDQTRPSANLNDYLDSVENADGDLVYDATNTSLSANYNDQLFIVAP